MTSETGATGTIGETGPIGGETGPVGPVGGESGSTGTTGTTTEYGVCFHFNCVLHDVNYYEYTNTVTGIAVRVFPDVTDLTSLPSNWKQLIYDDVATHCAQHNSTEYFQVDTSNIETKIGCITLVDIAHIGDESYYDFVSRPTL